MLKFNLSLYLLFFTSLFWGTKAQVTIQADFTQKPVPISPNLMGAFFEDINYAADGGLYAELVQNRSFEYYPVSGYTDLQPLDAWSTIEGEDAAVNLSVEDTRPLNAHNTKYLKMQITNPGSKAGVGNSGFDGIALKAGAYYDFSVYLRKDAGFEGSVAVQLVTPTGLVVAGDTLKNLGEDWQKFTLELKSAFDIPAARLQMTTASTGTLYADMVSLFPRETFNNRENGLRKDLAQAIADLQPRFLRFPGGCISHGRGLDNAYRWKDTVGDVAERKPNWNLWGYHQTYGLGFFEYFQFCEDIGAMPLPVVPVGVSCQFRQREIAPISEMGLWIDDALHLIEFANGSVESQWGSVRASMGHPEPFNMEYICLGNEEDDIPEFRERFMMITDSIRKYYPEIKIIGTSGTDDTGDYYHSLWDFNQEHQIEAVDEHYYNDPEWFLENAARYDHFDREGPKVFIGEYASRDDRHKNALAEAAFLTGVEKNGDVIEFACYAPLFSNVNHQQWHPDLIRFNNTSMAKTASYYVQQLYGMHAGDQYYPSTLSYEEGLQSAGQRLQGQTGLATWNTQAEFREFKISTGNEVLIEEDFSSPANWTVLSGTFAIQNGSYSQSSTAEPALSLYNLPVNASSYTISVKARKTGGMEGFLIPFAYNNGDYYWFNIAGWGNTQHAVEREVNGQKSELHSRAGSINSNQWYHIQIEVTPEKAACYLDGELIFNVPVNTGPVYVSSTLDNNSNEIILKLVNTSTAAIDAEIMLQGVTTGSTAAVTTLLGQQDDRNSLTQPTLIVPTEGTISVAEQFSHRLPASSFQVIRIPKTGSTSVLAPFKNKKNGSANQLSAVPNPADQHIQVSIDTEQEGPFALSLIDYKGRSVYHQSTFFENKLTIPRNNLPTGLYILQLVASGKSYQTKVSFK